MSKSLSGLNRLRMLVFEELWDLDLSQLSRFKRFLYKQIRLVFIVSEGFIQDLVKLQALALAFKMLLSIAPLLAVSFSLLKAFGVHNRLQPALAQVLAPLGPKGEEITSRLVEFVDNVNVGALGAVGLITLFLTVVSLMGGIEQAFNQIWKVKTPRKFARRFSDYLSVLLVGPVLIFSAVGVTASLQSYSLVQRLIAIEPFGTLILLILRLLPYLIIWAVFALLYVLIPNTSVPLKSALVGGLVAALVWESVGWAFASFVVTSTKYYAIYSSFAILLFFLLWIYVGWVIVLFGAEVAHAHQNLNAYLRVGRTNVISAAARETLALYVMALIGRSFYVGNSPWAVQDLAKSLNADESLIRELVDILTEKNLLIKTAEGQAYVPARDIEHITVKDVLDSIRTYGELERRSVLEKRWGNSIGDLVKNVDFAVAETLKGKNLKTLIQNLDLPNAQTAEPVSGSSRR